MTTIHWFRQDLRLADNRALTAAAAKGPVLPLYVLDDLAAGEWPIGGASRWWLAGSLAALAADLAALGSRLVLKRGRTAEVLAALAAEVGATAVHWTRLIEPSALALDQSVRQVLEPAGVACHRFQGALLFEPEAIKTAAGGPFRVFTPFSRACSAAEPPKRPLPPPTGLAAPKHWPASDALEDWGLRPRRPDWAAGLRDTWQPGEVGARRRLDLFLTNSLDRYADERDIPAAEATSRLSPHLHFGEIGAATCWHGAAAASANAGKTLAKFHSELLWREFSAHLLFHFPAMPSEPFQHSFSAFPYVEDPDGLAAWQRGRTGYPLVDAGMRELWATGIMHNRVRMVVASFLCKDLRISWRHGQRWFWDTLVDADLANNSASWQWVAGCGADAAPYFRIFNPVSQGVKFDPNGTYVRRWVPELARLPDAYVHAPWTAPAAVLSTAGVRLGETYPLPIVDHGKARLAALAAYADIKSRA